MQKFDHATFRCGWCRVPYLCTPPSRGSEIKSDCRSKLSRTRERTPFCGVCRVMRQLEKQRWPSRTSHWPCAPWCKPIVVNLKRGSRELAAGRWEARIRAGDGTESERGDGDWMARRARGHLLGRGSRVCLPPGPLGGWLSARPTSLLRIEYRNVIVMMGSCRQQRALGMALDLLVSADVGRFPTHSETDNTTAQTGDRSCQDGFVVPWRRTLSLHVEQPMRRGVGIRGLLRLLDVKVVD